jgi:hypothetical protein
VIISSSECSVDVSMVDASYRVPSGSITKLWCCTWFGGHGLLIVVLCT